MQPTSEEGSKNFEFLMIINFYAPFFGGEVHKSCIHNA